MLAAQVTVINGIMTAYVNFLAYLVDIFCSIGQSARKVSFLHTTMHDTSFFLSLLYIQLFINLPVHAHGVDYGIVKERTSCHV